MAGLKEGLAIWRVACGEIAAGRPLLIPTKRACSEAGIIGPGRDVSVPIGNTGGLTLTCCMLEPVLTRPPGLDWGRVTVGRMGCLRGDCDTQLPMPLIGASGAAATGGAPDGGGVASEDVKPDVNGAAGGAVIDSRGLRAQLPLILRQTKCGEACSCGCPAATTTFAFKR